MSDAFSNKAADCFTNTFPNSRVYAFSYTSSNRREMSDVCSNTCADDISDAMSNAMCNTSASNTMSNTHALTSGVAMPGESVRKAGNEEIEVPGIGAGGMSRSTATASTAVWCSRNTRAASRAASSSGSTRADTRGENRTGITGATRKSKITRADARATTGDTRGGGTRAVFKAASRSSERTFGGSARRTADWFGCGGNRVLRWHALH